MATHLKSHCSSLSACTAAVCMNTSKITIVLSYFYKIKCTNSNVGTAQTESFETRESISDHNWASKRNQQIAIGFVNKI